MTERPVGVTDVASGAGVADFRTRERSVGGNTVDEQYLVPVGERVSSFVGMAADWWAGNAAGNAVKCLLHNAAGSSILVEVRSVVVQVGAMTGVTSSPIDIKFHRSAVGSAGASTLTKVNVGTGADAAESSSASVVITSRHSSDNSTATAITTTLGTFLSRVPSTRMQTLSQRQTVPLEYDSGIASGLYELIPDAPLILRANEGCAVASAGAATNLAQICVNWAWAEYTLP